ncbi:MAG TPA: ankyrin repeat domain-containing protein [Candidatus Angelobacter sp.]|nr:ankyrin repeat domain-containing protein [Candidatus Angelobacter sp.]
MPKELPASPSLEHLKKQAKALLRDFVTKKPAAVRKFSALKLKAAPKLSDAQRLVAYKYGFKSWTKLKEHVDTQTAAFNEAVGRARKALRDDDPADLRRVLKQFPALKARINESAGDFGSPLINHVKSPAMLDAFLEAGADINARSKWAPGSFGLLDGAPPEVAAHAIERGAIVTVHAAARLGMMKELRELIAADPQLVHARGGDGQMPLHFAGTIEIAEYLLGHGADIDARDLDHKSTAAQWMLGERTEVARYLVQRGCKTDILMAAALGDLQLVQKLLEADPECIRMRVSDEYFPLIGMGSGGTIYQWQLGWYVSAVQVAKAHGHQAVFDLLMERCPDEEKLLNACWLHDEAMVQLLLERQPGLSSKLPTAGRRHVAHAARNNDAIAAQLMVTAGLPVNIFSQHHASALHWAAFHGNAEMAQLLVKHHAALEDTSNEYKGTALNWAQYGSRNAWRPELGDYPATVEVLLAAGAKFPKQLSGTEAVQEVLRRHGMK